jgi:hypothetical protein
MGDAWICMGEKSFIFMLERERERVNHPKNGRCMHLYGRKRLHFHAGEGKPPQKWRCMDLYGSKRLHVYMNVYNTLYRAV